MLKTENKQALIIGRFYNVRIIGTGWLLFKWGFHKYDSHKNDPCFLTDEGYRINENEYDDFEFAF